MVGLLARAKGWCRWGSGRDWASPLSCRRGWVLIHWGHVHVRFRASQRPARAGGTTEAWLRQGQPGRQVRLPPARTVCEWSPFDLGIWPVLAIPGRQQAQELPPLALYVARSHDADLDLHLADSASFMIVVTGTSRTGKSRSLYEALQRHERIKDWQLLIQPT